MRASAQEEKDLYYTEHKLTGMHGCQYEQTNIHQQVYQVLTLLPCSQMHVQRNPLTSQSHTHGWSLAEGVYNQQVFSVRFSVHIKFLNQVSSTSEIQELILPTLCEHPTNSAAVET